MLSSQFVSQQFSSPIFRRFRKFAFKEKPSYFSQTLKCGTIYIHRPLAGSGCEAIHADVFIPSYIIPSTSTNYPGPTPKASAPPDRQGDVVQGSPPHTLPLPVQKKREKMFLIGIAWQLPLLVHLQLPHVVCNLNRKSVPSFSNSYETPVFLPVRLVVGKD